MRRLSRAPHKCELEQRLLRCLGLCLLLVLSLQALRAADLLLPDGRWASAPSASIAHGLVHCGESVPLSALIRLRLNPDVAALRFGPGLVLVDGDRLPGPVIGFQADGAKLQRGNGDLITVPLARIAVIVLADGPWPLTGLGPAGPATASALPSLLLANGDRLTGQPFVLNDTALTFLPQGGRRASTLARTVISAIRLHAIADSPGGSRSEVHLGNGGHLSGELLSLDSTTLRLRHGVLGEISLSASAVRGVLGGGTSRLRPLPTPTAHEVPEFLARYPYARDAAPAWTNSLTVAGRYEPRGFACHSRCALTFPHDGSPADLVCEAALLDSAPAHAEAALRVTCDGTVRWSSTVRAGQAAIPLRIPLTGVRSYTLTTDPGRNDDERGDHVMWIHPVLVLP